MFGSMRSSAANKDTSSMNESSKAPTALNRNATRGSNEKKMDEGLSFGLQVVLEENCADTRKEKVSTLKKGLRARKQKRRSASSDEEEEVK